VRDWRQALQQPRLPFLVVELAAYCNEHDASTCFTWCDEKTSILNATDTHLPDMRLAQTGVLQLPHVAVVPALDLGTIHPLQGSIHSAAKEALGARIALAAMQQAR